MKKPIDSKRPRKRTRKTSSSKTVYREHQLMKRLLRYTDRKRVWDLLDSSEIEEFPKRFFGYAEGHRAANVTVDWSGVRAGLEAAFDTLATGRAPHLSGERLSQIKRFRATEAALYILEFLPEVIDSALNQLYLEAWMKVSVQAGRPWARPGIEILSKMDYSARVQRLGIQEGPRARFQHRSQYEAALTKAIADLISDNQETTQDAVASKLSVECEEVLDSRELRRWNKEFGVNWKTFVKHANRTNLT